MPRRPHGTEARNCGAKRQDRPPCGLPAGWGTDHVGTGRCKFHGGASPTGRRAAKREQALEFARGALGAEVAVQPLEALAQSVRLAAGLVDYYRHELADAATGLTSRDQAKAAQARVRIGELVGPYGDAIKLEKDVSKAATDAGVLERRQLLAERTGQALVAAFHDALGAVTLDVLDADAREVIRQRFADRLAVLEGEAVELEGPLALPSGG